MNQTPATMTPLRPNRSRWLQAGIVATLAVLLVTPMLPNVSAAAVEKGCFFMQATNKAGTHVGKKGMDGTHCEAVADGGTVIPTPTPTVPSSPAPTTPAPTTPTPTPPTPTTPPVVTPAPTPTPTCSMAEVQKAWAVTDGLPSWNQQRIPATSPIIAFSPTYDGLANVALLETSPSSSAATSSRITTSTSGCLAPGTYEFSFSVQSYTAYARDLTLTAAVLNADTSATLASTSLSTTSSLTRSQTRVLKVTVDQPTQVHFQYTYTFAASSISNVGDKLGVTAPTVVRI